GYFERNLANNPDVDRHSIGNSISYVDLSLFHVIDGLRYAFRRATQLFARQYPLLIALHDQVPDRPNIARYLA
ncbi:UNVERIFIED_CONTAM: glutathione S-transferase C-terminal domain-containing protein, partial [Salmonella enterica subsp. enterica serovar Enteritidis]